jgi:type I restriction enzyme M protein
MIEEGNLIDCIVNMPSKLFLNTQIPVALWILSKDRKNGKFRNREREILFIDARNMGEPINRRTRVMSRHDIEKISHAYHSWRNLKDDYADEKGFCCSAPIEKVKEFDYLLTPGRYVGFPDEKDDFDFKERFEALKAEFMEQLKEEEELNKKILKSLSSIKL